MDPYNWKISPAVSRAGAADITSQWLLMPFISLIGLGVSVLIWRLWTLVSAHCFALAIFWL